MTIPTSRIIVRASRSPLVHSIHGASPLTSSAMAETCRPAGFALVQRG
jgi:hypothetical protein